MGGSGRHCKRGGRGRPATINAITWRRGADSHAQVAVRFRGSVGHFISTRINRASRGTTSCAGPVICHPWPSSSWRKNSVADQVLTETFFEQFDLHPHLADCGFTRCTPIQELTLPVALEGRDVAGQAQTGTGKTCAFLVAVMNRLLTKAAIPERKDNDPRAVILAPTRELAIQIDKDAQAIGRQTGLRFALIYGGVDYDKQRQQLRDGCDVIIATPGRLIDYFKQHVFSF